jgi:RluA family pseudouridine synthase
MKNHPTLETKQNKAWKVDVSHQGERLSNFIRDRMHSLPLRAIKRAIERGSASVNGVVERFSSKKLQRGDGVTFVFQEAWGKPSRLQIEDSMILYEDEILLVLNKPAKYPSNPTGASIPSVLEELQKFVCAQGGPPISLLHRLDRDTSGVLGFVKDSRYKTFFMDQFKNHQASKVYHALLCGIPKQKSGEIKNYLGLLKKTTGNEHWGVVPDKGLEAITEYEVLESWRNTVPHTCLVALYPKTGRTHQLRVHMAFLGCPILGDLQYDKPGASAQYNTGLIFPKVCERHMLHASVLTLKHPERSDPLIVEAPFPEDFETTMEELHKSVNSKKS